MTRNLGSRLTRLEKESAPSNAKTAFEDTAVTEAWVRTVLQQPYPLEPLSSEVMPEGETARWLVAWGRRDKERASLEAKTQ